MQTGANIPHEWWKDALRFLAELGVLSALVAGYKAWKERRKPDAEIRELNAKTELTLVKANIAASEMVRQTAQEMMEQLELAQVVIAERDQLKRDVEMLRGEKRLLYIQVEQDKEVFNRHPELRRELDKLTRTSGG